jgi:hypothetical protein
VLQNGGKFRKGRFASFIRRHPEINVVKAEGISLSRDQEMNKKETRKYFDLLEKTFLQNILTKEPG